MRQQGRISQEIAHVVIIINQQESKVQFQQHHQEMAMGASCCREVQDNYEQRVREYNSQVPFAFRVQLAHSAKSARQDVLHE